MKRILPATWTLAIVVTLLVVCAAVSLYGFKLLHDGRSNLVDLYQLKSDILQANIALRNAAIAYNQAQTEAELAKMLVTRSSANDVYDRLTAADLPDIDKVILAEMKKERPEYREAQMKVVNAVRKGKSEEAWDHMTYYQTLMDRYISRVDKLISHITKMSHSIHIRVQSTILGFLGVSILIAAVTVWKGFHSVSIVRKPKEALNE